VWCKVTFGEVGEVKGRDVSAGDRVRVKAKIIPLLVAPNYSLREEEQGGRG
jgi:hypothetical protein